MNRQITDIKDLVNLLGGPGKLGAKIGLKQPSISMWAARGEIPAHWRDALNALVGPEHEISPGLFRMKKTHHSDANAQQRESVP